MIALILFVGLPFIVGAYVVISAARVRCMAIFAIVVCFTAGKIILNHYYPKILCIVTDRSGQTGMSRLIRIYTVYLPSASFRRRTAF